MAASPSGESPNWIVGDVFTEVIGREGATRTPTSRPAAARRLPADHEQRRRGDGHTRLLRPEAARIAGDEPLQIAGSRGVIETALVERKVTLSTADRPPEHCH